MKSRNAHSQAPLPQHLQLLPAPVDHLWRQLRQSELKPRCSNRSTRVCQSSALTPAAASKNITIKRLLKLRLLRRFAADSLTPATSASKDALSNRKYYNLQIPELRLQWRNHSLSCLRSRHLAALDSGSLSLKVMAGPSDTKN